jgi:hypothetical protein
LDHFDWQSLARSTGKVYYDGSSEFGSLKLSRADSCLHWRKLKCNMPKTDLQSRLAMVSLNIQESSVQKASFPFAVSKSSPGQ